MAIRTDCIILSIYPQFAKAIMTSKKKVEFRKKMLPSHIKKVMVYSTSPQKELVGFFEVGGVDYLKPVDLWDKFSLCGGIDESSFYDYFSGTAKGYGIKIRAAHPFCNPVKLDCIGKKAPQVFCYITSSDFNKICNLGGYLDIDETSRCNVNPSED